ncbi:ATP-binding cassette domain-containing protein [uncultured Desulfobacter sp.]|uniref:phosphate ABC transporter ATP-binding protein n=1 Tax=uncultured Desulfobacter sp. TaxID=240139 RepID=UPI002AAA7144|nr:ATP-binding cassette domain-containing protein [uncultured Desulfobacter sp.]
MQNSVKIKIRDLSFYYRTRIILENINIDIYKNTITSITGPSGQGKSSFLTILNRLCQNMDGARVDGLVAIDFGHGFEDIFQKKFPLPELRKKVGMVFQIPNPLPMSIYKNVAFPLKLAGNKNQDNVREKVKNALEQASLWEEVKDRLSEDARLLSGGQQQRLCLARSLVLDPQVLLLDEPTSSLDDTSVKVIEKLLGRLKNRCTIIMVSHYMDQVKRIADQQFVLRDRQLKSV